MQAARDFDPAAVRPRGGHYINGVLESGRAAIELRRPSDNQAHGEIPDAGAEGVDQAVRIAQAALTAPRKGEGHGGLCDLCAPNFSALHEVMTIHNITAGPQFGKRC